MKITAILAGLIAVLQGVLAAPAVNNAARDAAFEGIDNKAQRDVYPEGTVYDWNHKATEKISA